MMCRQDRIHRMEGTLFHAGELRIRPVSEDDIASTLEVYKQAEDFLSLGPEPTASARMVMADIERSKAENGTYCGVWDNAGVQIGVLDFGIRTARDAILWLLMISNGHRRKGHGRCIVEQLESYLKRAHGVKRVLSGVQINNHGAIAFWKEMGYRLSDVPKDMGDGTVAYEMTKDI